jgi:hypothetical protein
MNQKLIKYELWFDEDYSEIIHKKQAKFEILHNPRQINGDKLKNVRHKMNEHVNNKILNGILRDAFAS